MKKKLFCAAISIAVSLGMSCHAFADEGQSKKASERAQQILDRLGPIASGKIEKIETDKETDMKLRAMKEAAQTLGAQEGYSYYINRFVAQLENGDIAIAMKQFNFQELMTTAGDDAKEMYVLPPVIEQLNDAEAVNNTGTQLKLSGRVYRILSNVRLVTAPPTWRDYLVPFLMSDTNTPPENLLPKTPKEKEKWKNWIREGFFAGLQQGDREMKYRVDQLRTDYVGMVKYMELAEQNMVQKPVVAMQHVNVEGDSSQIKIRSSVYEITQGANLVPDNREWKSNATDD